MLMNTNYEQCYYICSIPASSSSSFCQDKLQAPPVEQVNPLEPKQAGVIDINKNPNLTFCSSVCTLQRKINSRDH